MTSYEVEHIVDKRIRRGEVQYMVKWKGYDDGENTWETANDIIDQGFAGQIEKYENDGAVPKKKNGSSRRGRRSKKSTPKKSRKRSKTPARRSSRKKKRPDIYSPSGTKSSKREATNEEEEDQEEEVAGEQQQVSSNDMAPVSSFGDVASWSDIQNGGMILAALAGGILHFVLQSVLESDTSIEKENPQLVFGVRLLTRVLPSLVACVAVRSVSDSIKNFNRATYVTFVDIGLVWCVAGDVIECVTVEPQYRNLCSVGMAIVAHLSFVIAFSSEIMGVKSLPSLNLPLAALSAGVAGALLHQSSGGDILKSDPEVASLVIAFCSTVWRAAARVGYGQDESKVSYATLPQWIGLLGACALACSQALLLGRMGHFQNLELFKSLDHDTMEAARLANYWIAMASIATSALMPRKIE